MTDEQADELLPNMVLGPLPKPFMELHRDISPSIYQAWADQMRAYAAEQAAAERERCARWAFLEDPNGYLLSKIISGEPAPE